MARRVWILIAAVIAIGMVVSGIIGTAFADEGLVRTATVVDGRPLTTVRAATDDDGRRRPGAVVVHGFAGSARLMLPIADTLARNGYVVVLPDLSGHGANRHPLALDARRDLLAADLDVSVRFLRGQPAVDPTRIVLIGHSMGAGAVTDYAATHTDIAATVALSLPASSDLPADRARPRNLLLLYGSLEFDGFATAAWQALTVADPTASYTLGHTYGDSTRGTARRAEAVPHVEHITILYAQRAHDLTVGWLNDAVQPDATAVPAETTRRLTPAELLLVGLLIGFYPLAHLLLRGGPAAVRPDLDWPRFGLALAAGVVGGLALSLAPDAAFGLAVGGYTALVFGGFAVAALAAWAVRRGWAPTRPRNLVGGLALTAYVTVAIAVPMHLGLTHATLVPGRWWLLGVVGLGCFGLFLTAEVIGGRRAVTHGIVLATALVLLTTLTLTGVGPGFTLLVLPLLAALLAVQAGLAAAVRDAGGASWIAAAAGALLLAWPITATLPLV